MSDYADILVNSQIPFEDFVRELESQLTIRSSSLLRHSHGNLHQTLKLMVCKRVPHLENLITCSI
jgi:hypothetical protein